MLIDFRNSFTGRLSGKCLANVWQSSNIPLQLKRVATLL